MITKNTIVNGDCFDYFDQIPDSSIDGIFCDLPYGVTKNKWDSQLPLDLLWKEYERIIKENGVICLFGQDKFSAKLMLSNEKLHRYNLIWKKGERVSGFLNAKKMPLRNHEDILIFYKKTPTYNPQFTVGKPSHSKGNKHLTKELVNNNYGHFVSIETNVETNLKHPKSIIESDLSEWELEILENSILNFDRPHPPIHATQKPVALLEWLIKTYTVEGDLVLDNCMGIGTTCIAAKNTNRNYIGIEKELKHFEQASKLIYG